MSKKLSELDPGAPLTDTDILVMARGSGNVKGTLSDVSDFVKTQSTLQNAYDASTKPQITTSPGLGAVQIKRGTALDSDVVSEVLNAVDTSVFSVTGEGDVTAAGNTNTKGLVLGVTATPVSGTFGANESIVGVTDTVTAPITITLATAAALTVGKLLDIKDESGGAGTNNITIDTEGSELIDGLAFRLIIDDFGAVRLYSDGANWFVIASTTKTGGPQVGDYIATEEIALEDGKVLLPADGTVPSVATFPILNALLPNVDKLTNISSIDQSVNRSLAVQADGAKGWAGKAAPATRITEYDFINLTQDVLFTPTTFSSTIYSICCSDAGDKIYALAANVATKVVGVARSLDSGLSWTELDITGVLVGTVFQISVLTSFDFGRIQCDSSGSNLRAIIMPTDTDGTRVYSSSDSGATWVEILTPFQPFAAPSTKVLTSFISRDLSTIGVISNSLTGEQYLSIGDGGAFIDKNTTLPRDLISLDKMAVSVDGNSVLLFNAATFSCHNIYISTDNMSTWTLVEVVLHDKEGSAASTIMSCQFHPTNTDLVYINSIESDSPFNGRISRLTISSKISKFIGKWNEGVSAVHLQSAAQIQSDIKLTATDGVMLSNSDPSAKDFAMVNIIDNDKFIADATNEVLTFKIVADAP